MLPEMTSWFEPSYFILPSSGNHLAVANTGKDSSIVFIDVKKNKVLKTHKVHTEVKRGSSA